MAGGRPYRGHALIAVVGFSGYRSAKVQAQADAVTKEMEARVSSAIRWAGLTETNAARTQALIVSSDPAVELEFKDVIAATSAQISEVQKSMEGMALSEQDRAQMAKIAAARKTMTELRAQARQLKADGLLPEGIVVGEPTELAIMNRHAGVYDSARRRADEDADPQLRGLGRQRRCAVLLPRARARCRREPPSLPPLSPVTRLTAVHSTSLARSART